MFCGERLFLGGVRFGLPGGCCSCLLGWGWWLSWWIVVGFSCSRFRGEGDRNFFGMIDWALWGLVCQFLIFQFFVGEFDPGSGRTLAACLTHASRTMKPFGVD